MATFFQKVSKPVFQNLTVENPPRKSRRKSGRTNERTNERTDGTRGFDLPTDVKSASRKNRFSTDLTHLEKLYMVCLSEGVWIQKPSNKTNRLNALYKTVSALI